MGDDKDDKDLYPPPHTGESLGSRGEDYAKKHRGEDTVDVGTTGAGRPAGTHETDASTSIDPKKPKDPDSSTPPVGGSSS